MFIKNTKLLYPLFISGTGTVIVFTSIEFLDTKEWDVLTVSYLKHWLVPSIFVFLSVFVSLLVLLPFDAAIFQTWRQKFLSWFGPVALLLIASGTDSVGYVWFPKTLLAIWMGVVLVVVTVLICLADFVHRKM